MKSKSDSLNSLPESGDSDLGLRVINPKMKNYKGSEKHSVAITATSYKEPPLVVYGPTKSTNTPVKPIESDLEKIHFIQRKRGFNKGINKKVSEIPALSKSAYEQNNFIMESGTKNQNSSKETSGKSPAQKFPLMTFSALASLVKVFPLRENVKVFKTSQEELFSLKSSESCEIKDQNTYSLRTLKDYFLTTTDERSQLYSFRWMNLGMMRNGLSQTLNITYRKTGKGSLSSVLEKVVDEKYYLSDESALAKQCEGRIRRLTPRECERLQGFPDGWTEGVSDTQRYKMMGNAVSVPVITAIGKRILNEA